MSATRDADFALRKTARAALRACREAVWAFDNMLDSPGRPELQHARRTALLAIETLRSVEKAAKVSLAEYGNDDDRK